MDSFIRIGDPVVISYPQPYLGQVRELNIPDRNSLYGRPAKRASWNRVHNGSITLMVGRYDSEECKGVTANHVMIEKSMRAKELEELPLEELPLCLGDTILDQIIERRLKGE